MDFAAITIFGPTEEIVVRSKTQEALGVFMAKNDFHSMGRLRSLKVTGPTGVIEDFSR